MIAWITFNTNFADWSAFTFWMVVGSIALTLAFTFVVLIGGLFDLRHLLNSLSTSEDQDDAADDGRH